MSEEQTKYKSLQLTDIECAAISHLVAGVMMMSGGVNKGRTDKELLDDIQMLMQFILREIFHYACPFEMQKDIAAKEKEVEKYLSSIMSKINIEH
jgi:hypothetical protein